MVAYGSRTRSLGPMLKQTYADFTRHRSQWLAAGISYFTIFAIAPLIIVTVELAGLVVGHHRAALETIYGYLRWSAGSGAAGAIRTIVATTFHQQRATVIAQIIGWTVFAVAALGLFASLQDALNNVWDVEPKRRGVWALIRGRITGIIMVLVMAALLLASLEINAGLTAAAAALSAVSAWLPLLIRLLDFALSFGLITIVFAAIFKLLPEARVQWRDVWIGAVATSLLFVAGQFVLGWYLGRAALTSGYGAFGALIVFLLWTNYSAQIMLFGAEFTHVYAKTLGSRCDHAVRAA